MDGQIQVVLVTCGSRSDAEVLAKSLVTERLAACVNIIDSITSVYVWEDSLQQDPECLLLIKTLPERFADLETRIQALHRYTVPEIIALPVIQGSKNYVDWVKASVEPQA